MCDINKIEAKLAELEDYLDYVNTDIDRLLGYEPDLYAAYAAYLDLSIPTIKDWYKEAEENFVSTYDVALYLQGKYVVWKTEDIDYYYEKEVYKDELLFESGSYFFLTDKN